MKDKVNLPSSHRYTEKSDFSYCEIVIKFFCFFFLKKKAKESYINTHSYWNIPVMEPYQAIIKFYHRLYFGSKSTCLMKEKQSSLCENSLVSATDNSYQKFPVTL